MEYGKKTRLGGFNVLKYKNGEMSYIKVSTIAGNWSMEYREDHSLFLLLDNVTTEEDGVALKILFVNSFIASSMLDAELQHDIMLAGSRFQERINANHESLSEEEDKEIIDNMKAESEMMEELSKEEEVKNGEL